MVLKQIPRRVRDSEKQYQFLNTKLIEREVNFRWLIPEGILVNWDGKRYGLDSIEKATEFYDSFITA